MAQTRLFTGGCHCRQVRFEVQAHWPLEVDECNCSICHPCGFLHLIVAKDQFRLLTEWSQLSCYTFNTGVAQHLFCSTCGIKSFYVPRSHPDGYSVNARCLDGVALAQLQISPFDGRNWEQNIDSIR